jgi:hypothetical protein
MTTAELSELLRNLPLDAVIRVCGNNGELSALQLVITSNSAEIFVTDQVKIPSTPLTMNAVDRWRLWEELFIEKEITFYRECYAASEARGQYLVFVASGFLTVLAVMTTSSTFKGLHGHVEFTLAICIVGLLFAVVILGLLTIRTVAARSSLYGEPLWKSDLVKYISGIQKLRRALREIHAANLPADLHVQKLRKAWLLMEPRERCVEPSEIESPDFSEKVLVARLELLLSFRHHVWVKAAYSHIALQLSVLAIILIGVLALIVASR